MSMNYADGRYVVTKIEGNRVFVESWDDPADVHEIYVPDDVLALSEWAKVLRPGLQILTRPHVYSSSDGLGPYRIAKTTRKRLTGTN
jgi:hypothetical protein